MHRAKVLYEVSKLLHSGEVSEGFLQAWVFEGKGKYKNAAWQKEIICSFWVREL